MERTITIPFSAAKKGRPSQGLSLAQLFLRLALGITFLVPSFDRLGLWGPHGKPGVSWGDWEHFSEYAHKLMFFLPYAASSMLAAIATVCEIVFGIALIAGWRTRWAAIGSGCLLGCFALSMAVALGITAPINYSVFTACAASLLLACLPYYPWSLDARSAARRSN